jgi:quercetin dioxygenase-like cupin family protein
MRELILAPGEGLSVENPMGGLFTFKITSEESDGALTAIETFVVRQEGPPLHVHDQDEVIYTLAGSLRVKLGETLREVPAGSFVFIPRGTPHTWQNVGSEPLRFFATIMPAAVAFEEFFFPLFRSSQVPTAGSGATCSAGRTFRTVTTAITAPASRIAAPTCSARWYPGTNSAG